MSNNDPLLEEIENELDQLTITTYQLDDNTPPVEEQVTEPEVISNFDPNADFESCESPGAYEETDLDTITEPIIENKISKSIREEVEEACFQHRKDHRHHLPINEFQYGIPREISIKDLSYLSDQWTVCKPESSYIERNDNTSLNTNIGKEDKYIYKPHHYYPKTYLDITLTSTRALTEPEWINSILNVEITSGLYLHKSKFNINKKTLRSNKASFVIELTPKFGPAADASGKMLETDKRKTQECYELIKNVIMENLIRENTSYELKNMKLANPNASSFGTKVKQWFGRITYALSFRYRYKVAQRDKRNRQVTRVGNKIQS